ncbi:MAG: phosphoenolpyruvate--protein phosphotransferase, partial [Actinobacteria bacterium]|nr:phosphoenolpyruvate--protein phosphotransferase [Actinomycetota bacterium]
SYDAWVGVCGEIAGDPLATSLLLGLGVTELSMSSPAVAAVKEAVRTTRLEDAGSLARRALQCDSGTMVRALLGEKA